MFQLTNQEVKELLDYFINRAGYISHEFDGPTHKIIERLQKHEREVISKEKYK
jgi:hypothetical protein